MNVIWRGASVGNALVTKEGNKNDLNIFQLALDWLAFHLVLYL